MLNHIVIMGRMVRDVELRRTGSGTAVANFTLAVERDYAGKDKSEKETDFIDCVAWRQTGEFASKHFGKGRMACVSGRLEIREWTDKDGNKRRNAEVNVDNIYFADSKNTAQNGNTGAAAPYAPNQYQQAVVAAHNAAAPAGNYGMIDDDEELPF